VHVLDEVPGPTGLVLWQSLRDVTLWAAMEDDREGLFTPDAARARLADVLALDVDATLEVSLTSLAALVGNPAAGSPEIVSLVCVQVSRWAEQRGAMATAMGFAQAAALAAPNDASAALAAGAMALRWRRGARAETWLRRATGLARRRHDWASYAQACVEMGTLHARRGHNALAQRFFVQGLRASRRHGLIAVRGEALHGLLNLAMEGGALDDAERYARWAMRAYGRGHARMGELMHDTAFLWVRREEYERAAALLQRILPTRVEPVDRALTLAILAHAAAGTGNLLLYQESWMDAWAVVQRRPGDEERHARALLELARASALLRDWAHAEQALRLASSTASPRGDRAVARQVEEMAAALRQRRA
jgi:tetratricopeptide (TPR) repeat protein